MLECHISLKDGDGLWGRLDQSFVRVWGRFDQFGDVLTRGRFDLHPVLVISGYHINFAGLSQVYRGDKGNLRHGGKLEHYQFSSNKSIKTYRCVKLFSHYFAPILLPDLNAYLYPDECHVTIAR